MKSYWVAVIWFAAIVVLIADVSWGISRHSDEERRASFQTEFGMAYPTTPVQKEIAKAVVGAHINTLYQKQLASWNRYNSLREQYEAIKDVPTFSAQDAQAKLFLSQEVKKSEAAHEADFERLGQGCSVLYMNGDTRADEYSELSIPHQSACDYYADPNN